MLRVSHTSNVKDVASTISSRLGTGGEIDVRVIGAGAVNQCVKAVAVARGMLASKGRELTTQISFTTVEGKDGDISAILFRLRSQ